MRRFAQRELREALAWAAASGQALHLHRVIADPGRAPACFRREASAGRQMAHLFDRDAARHRAAARRLGVRVVVVEREGQPGQHVDLCAGPLARALAACGEW